jgi:hypothetical protein
VHAVNLLISPVIDICLVHVERDRDGVGDAFEGYLVDEVAVDGVDNEYVIGRHRHDIRGPIRKITNVKRQHSCRQLLFLCNVITRQLACLRVAYPENLAVVCEPERHLGFELQVVGKKRKSSGKKYDSQSSFCPRTNSGAK